MSRLAQSVQQAVWELQATARFKKPERRPRMESQDEQAPSGAETTHPATGTETTTMAKKANKTPVAKQPKAEKAPKADRDPLAGLKAQPKQKGIWIATDAGLALTRKAFGLLRAENADLSATEQRELSRIVARLQARA